ncbi:NUDIX hydrolase [Paenibacillus physcomitrellae]|uniref:7,8-dihydro-8-oxoguanine triphosphatase n=1 Tax=Paenibacillus physcomitrellae TaxID=1619311 RepID=A0ABQ1GMZ3_9BACL|nr:8-oxo-dGTP diphosphatase [Paenibacillus physcomitrellae]GGA46697.1 7,8-dihydro-8-oxoguanine triphosphatase [Paenibacillus physcomitrellae]
MIKYNICLMRKGPEVLLLNRERSSWMGCWNGIGGKLESGETPRDSMIREIFEETGIPEYELHFKGLITWNSGGSGYGGMYTYIADVPEDYELATPIRTDEGILDWKKVDWILDPENRGIASNIVKTLDTLLNDGRIYDHHCTYEEEQITGYEKMEIAPELETDAELREAYFQHYAARRAGGMTSI